MNVTYLLGAGASANCLPTYANFMNRFSRFVREVRNFIKGNFSKKYNPLVEALENTLKEFTFHSTPDTIAKKYFHQNEVEKLSELKRIVTLFFLYEQTSDILINEMSSEIIKYQSDKRYDSFLASILKPEKGLRIYEQFQVLTWNYDLQMEIAFKNYSQKNLLEVQENLQSLPLVNGNDVEGLTRNKFSLLHLNGIAYPKEKVNDEIIGYIYNNTAYPFEILLNHYDYMSSTESNDSRTNISFAWENYQYGKVVNKQCPIEYAKMVAENTDILVIIGYSFPIFNREIDKSICHLFKRLSKVYVQDDQFDKVGSLLINDFLKDKYFRLTKEIVDVGYTNQFFIPPEWDSERKSQVSHLDFR